MSDRFALDGVTALVTGASSGLGAHFAATLAAAGAVVALGGRRRDRLEAVARHITEAGGQAMAVPFDVTDAAAIERGLDTAETAFGVVTLLINNSGVTVALPAVETDEASWDHVLDTNLKGAFLCARSVARRLIATKMPGAIVNIASILGMRVAGQVAAYAASKAALIQLTQSLALELARYRIRVNALAPGYIATELNADFLASPAGEALIRRVPQRRVGQLGDLDGPLLLLASDASRFMTGAVIPVDGGHLVSSL